jgi:hypothetical protein
MKKAFLYTVLLTFLPFLNSCSNYFFFEKPLPPEIQLKTNPHTIAFVNLFDYTSPELVKEKFEVTYRAAVINMISTLNSGFSSDSTWHFITADSLQKGINPGNLTLLLPVDSVKSLCRLHNADLLLTLDSTKLSITWDFDISQNDDGSKSKTKTFYLNAWFYLSLFDSSGGLIERSEVSKSSIYRQREALSILITFKPSLANAHKDAAFLGTKAAEDYVSKFYPSTTKESRMLYTGKVFSESNALMLRKDWTGAETLLNKLAENPDVKISRKAKYNLSVLEEVKQFGK